MKTTIKSLTITTEVISNILLNNKATRDSDDLLYLEVCKHYNPSIVNKPFGEVIKNRTYHGIPAFESVRRARAKLQSQDEQYRGTLSVKEKREAKRKAFAIFSKI